MCAALLLQAPDKADKIAARLNDADWAHEQAELIKALDWAPKSLIAGCTKTASKLDELRGNDSGDPQTAMTPGMRLSFSAVSGSR
jgi:hypothetical protein